jgi:hypothetical protein
MRYSIVAIDEPTTAFMTKVQSNWFCRSDVINGPDYEVLKMAGKSPSVRNLIDLWNYQMPPYGWFSPTRNKEAAKIALLKAQFFPVSFDQKWHSSSDEHLAMLWGKTNIVLIYRDEPNGLRSTFYIDPKKSTANSNFPSFR